MRYLIIETDTAEKMHRQVTEAITQGWRPQGGLSVVNSVSSGSWWYFQAMVHLGKDEAWGDPDA